MAGLTLERLLFDASNPTDGPNIGSYLIGAGGNVITETNVAADYGLDVNIINASLTVDASDLDIRDLTHVSDTVGIGDGTNLAAVNASLELQVRDDDANTDLDTLVGCVDGTEIQVDIVAALPAGDNNIGNVDIVSMPGTYVEDAASAGGETGMFILGVRQDAAGSPVSATGDYHGLIFNADGELKTTADVQSEVADDAADSGNPIKIGYRAHDGVSALSALSADGDRSDALSDLYRRVFINDAPNIGINNEAIVAGLTEVAIPASELAGRTRLMIQNNGDKPIFIGKTGVTTATGLEISKGGTLSLEAGEALAFFVISGSAAQDVRILELA